MFLLGTQYSLQEYSYCDRYYDMISKAVWFVSNTTKSRAFSLFFYSNWKGDDAHICSIFSDLTIKRFKTSRNFTENKSYIGPPMAQVYRMGHPPVSKCSWRANENIETIT